MMLYAVRPTTRPLGESRFPAVDQRVARNAGRVFNLILMYQLVALFWRVWSLPIWHTNKGCHEKPMNIRQSGMTFWHAHHVSLS